MLDPLPDPGWEGVCSTPTNLGWGYTCRVGGLGLSLPADRGALLILLVGGLPTSIVALYHRFGCLDPKKRALWLMGPNLDRITFVVLG